MINAGAVVEGVLMEEDKRDWDGERKEREGDEESGKRRARRR
jgi:hypothetical protein